MSGNVLMCLRAATACQHVSGSLAHSLLMSTGMAAALLRAFFLQPGNILRLGHGSH